MTVRTSVCPFVLPYIYPSYVRPYVPLFFFLSKCNNEAIKDVNVFEDIAVSQHADHFEYMDQETVGSIFVDP